MNRQSIEQDIRKHILMHFFKGDENVLTKDTHLLTTGILDSISALAMVDFIEAKFGIEFEAHEVDQDNLQSIEALTNFILSKRKA